jgi:hypothetical protein
MHLNNRCVKCLVYYGPTRFYCCWKVGHSLYGSYILKDCGGPVQMPYGCLEFFVCYKCIASCSQTSLTRLKRRMVWILEWVLVPMLQAVVLPISPCILVTFSGGQSENVTYCHNYAETYTFQSRCLFLPSIHIEDWYVGGADVHCLLRMFCA